MPFALNRLSWSRNQAQYMSTLTVTHTVHNETSTISVANKRKHNAARFRQGSCWSGNGSTVIVGFT